MEQMLLQEYLFTIMVSIKRIEYYSIGLTYNYCTDQVMIDFKESSQEVSEDMEFVEICAVLRTSFSLDCIVNYILTVNLIIPKTGY